MKIIDWEKTYVVVIHEGISGKIIRKKLCRDIEEAEWYAANSPAFGESAEIYKHYNPDDMKVFVD